MDTVPTIPPSPQNRLDKADWYLLLFIAVVGGLLNMAKPMVVDDAPYLAHAIQIAQHPLDPFGYTFTTSFWPENGLLMPAPPVFATYLAIGVKLLGDSPALLKLWVWPWFILLTWASLKLLKPWAGGWTLLAVGTLLLGPTFLPSVNLMLDVPALALTITGIALLRDYLSHDNPGKLFLALAILALALAPLTKYTGFSAPAAGVLLCLLHRNFRLAVLCALVPALFFIGWESFVYSIYHVTHLGYQTMVQSGSLNKLPLVQGFFILSWSMSPFLLPLAAVALGYRERVWLPLFLVSFALYFVMAFVDIPAPVLYAGSILFWASVLCACFRLIKPTSLPPVQNSNGAPSAPTFDARIDLFLVLWLAGEITLMFIISPFPASRRLMAALLVATFLLARLASRRAPNPPILATAALLVGSLATGQCFYWADHDFASATPLALTAFARETPAPGARHYVLGRWTVPYFAPRLGLQELTLDQTQLNPGDKVLIVTAGMYMPPYLLDPQALTPIQTQAPSTAPIDTSTTFGGPLGLRHTPNWTRTGPSGPQFTTYLVTQPTIIRSNPSEPFMRSALLTRKMPPSPLAAWALVDYALKDPKPLDNDFSKKLLQWGEPFLSRALDHPAPQARAYTIVLLAQNPSALTSALLTKITTLKNDPNPKVRDLAEKFSVQ